jgi:hypothetical protein
MGKEKEKRKVLQEGSAREIARLPTEMEGGVGRVVRMFGP